MDEPTQSQPNDSAAAEKIAMPEGRSGYSEIDATVLTSSSALPTLDFPAGMTPRELAHALLGEMLDHFKLQQFVGGGGMGVVFKALDTTLDRVVAVKVVASPSVSSEDLQRRFLVEAQSAARLDHPNIARVYDSGRSRGLPYIVFEYIEGANIRDLVVNHGQLLLGDALSYTYQIAHALAHAWQRDVVHRDIKPSNILVDQKGQAKLVDMGLARLYQVGEQEDDLTSTGVTLGTFDYISPEQARDPRLADARSDIYSLGCTLFYMLVGHPPFSEGTAAQKLLKHQEDQPPELLTLRDDLPESIARLVQRMLAKRPEDRPQSPTELVSELAILMRGLGLPLPHALAPLPSTAPLQVGPSWQRHVPWVIPVVALLVISIWINSSIKSSNVQSKFPPLRTTSKMPVESNPTKQSSTAVTKKLMSLNEPKKLSDVASPNDFTDDKVNAKTTGISIQEDMSADVDLVPSDEASELGKPLKSSDELMLIDSGSPDTPKQFVPLEEIDSFNPPEFGTSQESN